MDKEGFVKDFSKFFIEIKNEGVEVSLPDVAMLYAIYRKDLRAEKLNGWKNNGKNGKEGEPATEKQKQHLMDLAYRKSGLPFS